MVIESHSKRPLDLLNDSDSKKYQDETDSVAISLQEQIELEEIALQALLDRRRQVAQQLVSDEQKWHRLQAQAAVLEERKLTLQDARTKHSSLRAELQESLQKSREKLSKLEKIEAVSANLPTTSPINKELVSEILDGATESTFDDAVLSEERTPEHVADENTETAKASEALLRVPLLDTLAVQEYYNKRPRDKNIRYSSKFHPFLSMVDPKLVSRIMRHYQMETLVLDHAVGSTIESNSGDSKADKLSSASERAMQESALRRSLLRNTCLDFLILQPQAREDDLTSPALGGGEEESSMLTTSSSILQEMDGTTLTVPSALLDPNIPLCPYELSGICADEYCPYQHTDPNRKPILPRELLPLPALSIATEKNTKNEDKHAKPTEPSMRATSESSSENVPSVEDDPSTDPAPKESNDEKAGENVDDEEEEEEFITLPGMEEEDDEDEDMDVEESSNEAEGSALVESLSISEKKSTSSFWWWSDQQEIPELSHNLPLEDVLEALGGIKIVDSKQLEVPLPEDHDGSSRSNWICWLGRLVDCCRLAVFAGRHDLALAILDESLLPDASQNDNEHSPALSTPEDEQSPRLFVIQALREHELTSSVEVLHRIRQVVHPWRSLRYSVFQHMFAVHLSLAILSEYLKALRDVENQPTLVESQHQDGPFQSVEILLEVIDLLLGDDPTPSPEQYRDDDLVERVKVLFDPKTSTESEESASYQKLKDIVRFVLDTFITKSQTLRSIPVTRLEDELVKPIWRHISTKLNSKTQNESTSIHYLTGIALMGFAILSCLERFAADVALGEDALSPSLMAALTSLDSCIQQILKSLAKLIVDDAHFLNLILAPLIAASVSSACFLRQYSNAQNRLTMFMFRNQFHRSKWMQYSELMWSQLFHLRMSLPVDSETGGNAAQMVPGTKRKHSSTTDQEEFLAHVMETLGVRLNHISLIGDSNFTDLSSRSNKETEQLSTASEAIRRLILNCGSFPTGSKSIDLGNIELGWSFDVDIVEASKPTISTLPRSLLLPTQCTDLSLRNCKLERLPPSFGLDLTNVIRLDLSYNALQRLPVSIVSMTALEELSVNNNLLTGLPELPGSSLRLLNVSHNRLSTFPEFLLPDSANGKITGSRNIVPKRKKMRLRVDIAKTPSSFQKLEMVILSHNYLDQMENFQSKLILNLKNLRRLEIEPQGRLEG